jgi:A/G-specific adenine glycosylase
MNTDDFQLMVRTYYAENSRAMPWRISSNGVYDLYKITVSEMMLQQTQVDRVIPKFNAFIRRFPDIASLASSELQEVLLLWSGLGYNRRAKYLYEFAVAINNLGTFPSTAKELSRHKGIGSNTAAAILVYTHNEPHFFIETNVRTVYINSFFNDKETVSDAEIIEKLTTTIDSENPREFYWGLMDYGSYLKKQNKGALAKSKSHKKQSTFAGSVRQLRGRIIKIVSNNTAVSIADLQDTLQDHRLLDVLTKLEGEQMVRIHEKMVYVA